MTENTENPVIPPKLLKKTVSNIDIYVLAHELNQVLEEGFIQNIYELTSGDLLQLKCRTKGGKRNIIIDPKKRANFTEFNYPVPPYPSQFILSLRKVMKGRRIEKVYQYNLDRILVFQLKSSEGPSWKFIIEFFGGGNFILVNGENLVHMAKSYKKLRDRSVLPKKPYEFPEMRGLDIWTLDREKFFKVIQSTPGEIVRIIARNLNIGGYLSEEICKRAKVDKKTDTSELDEAQQMNLYKTITHFIESLKNFQFSPRIITDANNQPIGFEPIELEIYSNYGSSPRSNYNATVDEFFSKFDSEILFAADVRESQGKVSKAEKILKKQLEKIDDSKITRTKSLKKGHLIYQYLHEIDTLIHTIMTQKRQHKRSWSEISEILEKGKSQNIPECMIFEKIFAKEVKMEVVLENTRFKLDLKKTAIENAEVIYSRAKKAKKKIIGAEKAALVTKQKIEKQKEHHEEVTKRKAILLKKPKLKWYEKFRWFISSDGFVISGGRNATDNEALVRKYMGKHDLFFHTDVRGASVCIIRNDDNLDLPELTIAETAKFAACYSSAWKMGWGSADIYYVQSDQVSKTPKSGEYLNKGSFILTGKKTFLTKPYLELAVGVQLISVSLGQDQIPEGESLPDSDPEAGEEKEENLEETQYFPKIITAPPSAMKKVTQNFVIIKPSKKKMSTSELAKKILRRLQAQAKEDEQKWVALASINDMIRVIPPGNGEIAR